ncbi:intI [Acinetobacter baumannii ABNIH5]|nr:intI [Acinetobacter baumannii ABNIH5]
MRISEGLQLRVKDLDFDHGTIIVREGKGSKDRALMLPEGTVAKLAMRQPFVLFKGLTFQKLCLPGAFRPGDHHNKMLRPGLCVVHASPQYL